MTGLRRETGEDNRPETGYLTESTIGDQGRRRIMTLSRSRYSSLAQSALEKPPVREQIARRAYELYVQRGQVHGHDVDDWLKAEQMVLDELGPHPLGRKVKGSRSKPKRAEKP
jgi:hypothetical protein